MELVAFFLYPMLFLVFLFFCFFKSIGLDDQKCQDDLEKKITKNHLEE